MKKFSIIIFLISACFRANAQCPPAGDITLSSQADVNNFQTLYGSCLNLVVNGNLQIRGGDVTNLLPLANLKGVTGNLDIRENAELISLAGLENLEYTGNRLYISDNAKLVNLDGLAKLEQVGEGLEIGFNASLVNLNGLAKLEQIGEYLTITNNALLVNLNGLAKLGQTGENLSISNNSSLVDISGLSALTSVGGNMYIWQNPELVTPGTFAKLTDVWHRMYIEGNDKMTSLPNFPKLKQIGEDLYITNNASLLDISGLSALTFVVESMYIRNNPVLVTPGTFAELTDVGETLYIELNAKMTSLPIFPKMVNFSGTIQIINNAALTSLAGLSELKTIGLGIRINNNSLLTSLNGLGNLKLVNQYFQISENNSLTNISAIQGATISENLEISSNPLLGTCAIASVCLLLNASPDQLSIAANATGCNNIEEIQKACEAVLPVTLVSFSGKLTAEGSAALVWITSFETNSDHFVIEHRITGNEQWSSVGKVPAKRESNALATYDFIHTRPASGENLYRLKMVDADQTFAYSRIISIRNKELTDLFAYPNPVTNKLHFSGSGVTQISVFDASGTLRLKGNLTNKNEVDMKILMPGKYLLKVQTTDGRLHSQSVFKY